MTRTATQNWTAGSTVKVGFMTLTVIARVPTPGDYRPDVYHLISAKGAAYTFQPHYGLTKGHHDGQ